MNSYANGNGRGSTAVMEFEATPYSEWEWEDNWTASKTAYDSKSAQKKGREFNRQRTLPSVSQVARQVVSLARYLAPLTVRVVVDAVPAARGSFNPLTAQLLHPFLLKGEQYSRQKEAEFFGIQEAEIEVANRGVAHDAALTEVLAAEASHTESESEAAALIGTVLPLSLRIMEGQHLLRPVLPVLLVATARLVRFLHRYSPGSRRLLRLLPTIVRRTVASLIAARRWGCPLRSALIGCVMAAQTRRVLGNAQLVSRSLTRNVLIRVSTVSAAPSFPGVRRSSQNRRFF